MLVQIDIPYACFGITVKHGVVIEAAPIGKWMIGKPWKDIKVWVNKKKGKCVCMHNPPGGQNEN